MAVRPATREDLDTICDLIVGLAEYEHMADEIALDPEALGRWLFGEEPAAHVLVATEDEVVVGMALWFPTFSTFLARPGIWLEDLFVEPDHRGKGHGTALLDALRQQTEGRLEWSVLEWNQPAIDFYERLGARPVSGWTRYRWLPANPSQASVPTEGSSVPTPPSTVPGRPPR